MKHGLKIGKSVINFFIHNWIFVMNFVKVKMASYKHYIDLIRIMGIHQKLKILLRNLAVAGKCSRYIGGS